MEGATQGKREPLGSTVLTERMGRMLRLELGDRVLDMGCGTGSSAMHVAEVFGAQVIGVDNCERSVAVAKSCGKLSEQRTSVSFMMGDAGRLPFANESFDAVYCERGLNAFADADRAVGEMARLIKGAGCIGIVDTYVAEGYGERARPLMEWLGLPGKVETLVCRVKQFEERGMDLQCFEPCGHLLSRYLESLYLANNQAMRLMEGQAELLELLERLWELVELGNIGYGTMVFRKREF